MGTEPIVEGDRLTEVMPWVARRRIVRVEPFEPLTEIRVETARSVYLLREGRWARLTHVERPRLEDQLSARWPDGVWHPLACVTWCFTDHDDRLLRIVPPDRPSDAAGIVSSRVQRWLGE